jgi:ubiquinone/menaquinone biosynthesis C-methylase UbiE
MVKMDITDIQYPDNSFDVVYCSHVLEHVPDDRKAMRELARVLKPTGWAILAVPIFNEKTFEDPTITSPEERERVFRQSDHVRIYGRDFVDRLRESGFDVTVDRFASGFSDEMVRKHGLSREDIYLCRKRPIPHSQPVPKTAL